MFLKEYTIAHPRVLAICFIHSDLVLFKLSWDFLAALSWLNSCREAARLDFRRLETVILCGVIDSFRSAAAFEVRGQEFPLLCCKVRLPQRISANYLNMQPRESKNQAEIRALTYWLSFSCSSDWSLFTTCTSITGTFILFKGLFISL